MFININMGSNVFVRVFHLSLEVLDAILNMKKIVQFEFNQNSNMNLNIE